MEEVMNNNPSSDTTPQSTPEPAPQTQQINSASQLPTETKEDKGNKNVIKLVIASLILLVLVIAGVALNWNFFRLLFISQTKTSQSTQQTTKQTPTPVDTSDKISIGNQTIKMGKGGKKEVLLPDNETWIGFTSGDAPDVVFGERKTLNDIHNINYLSVPGSLSFYNNSYLVEIQNTGCNKERQFFGDYWATVTTDCTLQVVSRQEEAPIRNLEPFTKTLTTTVPFNNQISSDINTPFIYLKMPELYVRNFSTPYSSENISLSSGKPPNRSTSFWDIGVITAYGIETVRYEAQEIWDKETKQVNTGPLTTTSTIDNLECRVIFTGDEGQQNEQCDVTISFSFSQDETNLIPIKLSSYSQ
jgi:hypothetical protein